MIVYQHDRERPGNRLSIPPRRTPLRSWRERRGATHQPGLELLERRVVLSPTIFTVNSTASGTSGSGTSGTLPYVTSQANANANSAGSEIEFDSSVFESQQTITLSATLVLAETAGPEVIEGPGTDLLTVSGNNAVGVFAVGSGVTAMITGLTITDGSTSTEGGGLYSDYANLTLTDCTVSGNSAGSSSVVGFGGGLYCEKGTATLTNCNFTNNFAGGYGGEGGLCFSSNTTTLTNCTISGNSVPGTGGSGGGLQTAGGTTTVDGCTISSNSVGYNGGALADYGGMTTLTNCTISGNSAAVDGAGVASNSGGTTTLINCTVSGNSASSKGGGLNNNGGTLTLTACTITGNTAAAGGGLYDDGTAALTDTIVAGNFSPRGASDISRSSASTVTGTHNLIGTGGSGGITGGTNGNIVLTSLAKLRLAPLGDYGGSTEAIGFRAAQPWRGSAVSGVTTDERGEPLAYSPKSAVTFRLNSARLLSAQSRPVSRRRVNVPVASVTATLNEPAGTGFFGTSPL